MEPKKYQSKILKRLSDYLKLLDTYSPANAYRNLWASIDIKVDPSDGNGMPPYRDTIEGVPHVCFKVPTGGGKTFIATCALRLIKDSVVQCGEGTVVWLVPSDAILEQTLTNLKNPSHPYRQQLQKDFPAGVEVYSKDQLINGQNFQNPISVQEHLSVFVLSFDSFRTSAEEGRRAYRENEKLRDFPISNTLPDGADETSLVNAINVLNPIVVVDESHHATSKLSVKMLNNFNPRFILDLTATPRENSNIIAFAEASELKKANMVKLPLIVYNRSDKKQVLHDAIQLRAHLERLAIDATAKGGKYIRPIVLFQAQPKGKEDSATFPKLKEELVAGGISKDQVAIKTANVNELRNVDLLSPECPIRYIITVNALKEGWDCPFAYILATLANKTSRVDVEQIVGRILRQPFATQHCHAHLNNAFVLTCSNDFFDTLDDIVKALNNAGYSKKDVRVADDKIPAEDRPHHAQLEQTPILPDVAEDEVEYKEEFLGDYSGTVGLALSGNTSASIEDMLVKAEAMTQEYEQEVRESESLGYLGGVEGSMKNQFRINPEFASEVEVLKIPQFCLEVEPSIMSSDEYIPLSREYMSKGFELATADCKINFSISSEGVYSVDASESGPKYKKITAAESDHLRSLLVDKRPDESKRMLCVDLLVSQLEKKTFGNNIPARDIHRYVERVVERFTDDDFGSIHSAYLSYADKIAVKIASLLSNYSEERFDEMVETNEILCKPLYKLPNVITPTDTFALDKSLYESEDNVNNTERKIIEEIVRTNARWWHRIKESKDYSFKINGFINHYPDFIVMTERNNLLVIEVKGDHSDNSDSKRKLKLGRKWAEKAGDTFKYFMVFDELKWKEDGAFSLSDFIKMISKL